MIATDLPELDLFSDEYLRDAHGVTAALRYRSPAARTAVGFQVLTFAGCEAAFLDPNFAHGAQRAIERVGIADAMGTMRIGRALTMSEGADHAALRRAVQPWFTPRRIKVLRERTRELVQQRLDDLADGGRCDFMADVAERVPGVVFAWMVGAPDSDGARLVEWSTTLLRGFRGDPADAPAILAAAGELKEYVEATLAARRAAPGDDVVSCLVAAVGDGTITDDDVHGLVNEMLAASTDNTSHSAGIVLWLLLSHPGQWDAIVADRSLIPNAIEECLRFEPRVRIMPTIALAGARLGSMEFPEGSLVNLDLASAHRDPLAWPDPDTLDVTRKLEHHQLNFGVGRHYCLGAALARMELITIFETLAESWSSPRIDGEVGLRLTLDGAIDRLPVGYTPLRAQPG